MIVDTDYQEATHRGASRKWLALAGVTIPSVLGCIDFTIVNTTLPLIQAQLGASLASLQWVVNGFLLALSTFMILAGRLGDLYGRRRVLYVGLAGFGIASLGAGFAPDVSTLIAARVVQGVACAILYTGSAAVVADAFPADERGRALGLLFGANGVGLAVGPAVGGLLAGAWGWPAIFLVNVPLILLAILLCAGSVEETRGGKGEALDLYGTALLLIALPLLVIALLQGAQWGWTSPLTVGLLAMALAALALLYQVEQRASDPILPPELLARPAFAGSLIATAGLGAFYCTIFFLLPIFLQGVRGLDPENTGFILLTATLAVALASPLTGRWVDRLGARTVIAAGFGCFILSASIQSLLPVDAPLWQIAATLLIMGVGWAAILGPSTASAIGAAEGAAGLAVGIASTLHNLGGALGLAVATLLYELSARARLGELSGADLHRGLASATGNPELFRNLAQKGGLSAEAARSLFGEVFVHGYHAAALFLAALSIVGLLLALRLLPPHRAIQEK